MCLCNSALTGADSRWDRDAPSLRTASARWSLVPIEGTADVAAREVEAVTDQITVHSGQARCKLPATVELSPSLDSESTSKVQGDGSPLTEDAETSLPRSTVWHLWTSGVLTSTLYCDLGHWSGRFDSNLKV